MMPRLLRYLIFLLILSGICLFLGYSDILFNRPQSIHQWAQCDRASVAFNYYTHGFHFFKPQVHNISNGSGFTGLEFPFLNFLAALGYALFGFHEYIYRGIVLLFLFSGLLNAYRLSDLILKNSITAGLAVYLLFASPILVYYGISFLPDPVSLGLSLSGWFYFFKWQNNHQSSALIATIILCTLSSMIKISALISPLAMAAFVLLKGNIAIPNNHIALKRRILHALTLLIVLVPVAAWYNYASWLNKTYDSKVFMIEMRPVSSLDEFIAILKEIEQTWLWRFYPRIYFIAIAIATIAIAVLPNKLDRRLLTITLLLYFGAFAFFFLMFTQFRIHDYYVIPLMPAFFFHWLLIIKHFSMMEKSIFRRIAVVLLFSLVCFVTAEAKDHLIATHDKTSWMYSPRVNDSYYYLEPELRKHNISPDDPVISLYDVSPNVTLYLMNQRGITIGPLTSEKDILKELQNPLYKYAILNNFNPTRFDHVLDSLHLGKKILEWNELTVYRLTVKK